MNSATFIYILASLALIVAFAYADCVQDTSMPEQSVQTVLAGDDAPKEPTVAEEVVEEARIEDVTLESPMYILASHRPKTYAQLHTDLERIPNPPYRYKLHEYDCSQMSAFMEYQLEAKGYDTTISCSYTLGHAWVTVHNIIDHNRVDVECIPPMYIKPVHHEIEVSYENITEALNGQYPNEWEWR